MFSLKKKPVLKVFSKIVSTNTEWNFLKSFNLRLVLTDCKKIIVLIWDNFTQDGMSKLLTWTLLELVAGSAAFILHYSTWRRNKKIIATFKWHNKMVFWTALWRFFQIRPHLVARLGISLFFIQGFSAMRNWRIQFTTSYHCY